MYVDTTPLRIEAPKTLNVVTAGAHLLIDISKNVKTSDFLEARNEAGSKYPEGCVKAIMITRDRKAYAFRNQGILWSNGEIQLSLSSKDELETDLEFTRVELSSCKPILEAEITWVNYAQSGWSAADGIQDQVLQSCMC